MPIVTEAKPAGATPEMDPLAIIRKWYGLHIAKPLVYDVSFQNAKERYFPDKFGKYAYQMHVEGNFLHDVCMDGDGVNLSPDIYKGFQKVVEVAMGTWLVEGGHDSLTMAHFPVDREILSNYRDVYNDVRDAIPLRTTEYRFLVTKLGRAFDVLNERASQLDPSDIANQQYVMGLRLVCLAGAQ